MVKNKYLDEKKTIGIVLIFSILIFVFIYFNGQNRKEKLANNSLLTIGVIEKLVENVPKGTTTRKDVVYFYFIQNDTVFHKIENLAASAIKLRGLKINDCFETKIVKPDYKIFDIDFNKRKDTTLHKSTYLTHEYNSGKHKDIIE